MTSSLHGRLNYSNVVASLALFVALGGSAAAVMLPKNSVGPKQLKRGAVTAKALRKGAVTSRKIAPKAVTIGKLGPSSVGPGNIGNGAVTAAKLQKRAVTNEAIAPGVVGTNKLGNGVVTTVKLADGAITTAKIENGSVTLAKLGDEVAPLLGTLRSGQTLRGVFNVGGTAQLAGDTTHDGVSYQFPLTTAAAVTVVQPGATTANCPGISGGGAQPPLATAGNLCLYLTTATNLDPIAPLVAENNTRLGFGVAAKAAAAPGEYLASGQWAVTAP